MTPHKLPPLPELPPAGIVIPGRDDAQICTADVYAYLPVQVEQYAITYAEEALRQSQSLPAGAVEVIPATELRDSFRWNALLNRIDTASAEEFGTLLNIIGDARALGCGCLEKYVDQIDVGEPR